ncbi:LuxR family transcriptional regulator [Oscillatoria sp. FACHB-1407]|uniref:helix-turn-helix transcriptional regulator n=1 Tax=Oscillatoria sp. FACHB-1407 TaxID=2692847 RepID=UPI001689B970|nr:LuxR C-terminal-related transcriptional regulator [Oscillatoria sp. FACHB-1407]MBD2463024.1 LuxR family transcriptional regulator [Oscillatoria sp. FACHB-1407]
MTNSLQALFQAIAQAQDETELKQPIMAILGEYFAATRWGLSFLDQFPIVDANTPGMLKLALSVDYNPILRYLIQRHAVVHEEMILPHGMWQTICPRPDHGHVMLGPIISRSQLVGGIGFTRHQDSPPFNAENLADLSALCLHLSTRLAELRAASQILQGAQSVIHLNRDRATSPIENRLTPRERQIADLVAQGLTNAQIGTALWITEHSVKQALKRMFRKLEISSRAELAARLTKPSIAVNH